jgi:hypothetical protein
MEAGNHASRTVTIKDKFGNYQKRSEGVHADDKFTEYWNAKEKSITKRFDDGRRQERQYDSADVNTGNYKERATGPHPDDNWTAESRYNPSTQERVTIGRIANKATTQVKETPDGNSTTTSASPIANDNFTKTYVRKLDAEFTERANGDRSFLKYQANGNFSEDGFTQDGNYSYHSEFDASTGVTTTKYPGGEWSTTDANRVETYHDIDGSVKVDYGRCTSRTTQDRTVTECVDGTRTVKENPTTGRHPEESGDRPPQQENKINDNAAARKTLEQSKTDLNHTIDRLSTDPKGDSHSIMSQADRSDLLKHMREFETRANHQHMPPNEVAETYQQMERLLSTNDAKVSAQDRVQLAKEVMLHSAEPRSVKQGDASTCNVTSLAQRIYERHPSKMAEMITTTALIGDWKAPDGKMIHIDQDSLRKGSSEGNYPQKGTDRSFATQIANVVMANDATQRRVSPQYYSQGERTYDNESGERLYDRFNKGDEGYANGDPRMRRDVVDAIGNGAKPTDLSDGVVKNAEIEAIGKRLTGESDFVISADAPGSGTISYQTETGLNRLLQQKQLHNDMPLVAFVNQAREPIAHHDKRTDDPRGIANHLVSVTDYDPKTMTITISDSASPEKSYKVNLHEFFTNSLMY